MREILISIQPQWVEKILNGEKTIEIRKTMPKCELPVKVYIYCTKRKRKNEFITKSEKFGWVMGRETTFYNRAKEYDANGRVVAEFTLNKVDAYDWDVDFLNTKRNMYYIKSGEAEKTCLTYEQLCDYGKGKDLYGWHIESLKIYDKPKELSEFRKELDCDDYPCNKGTVACKYSYYDNCEGCWACGIDFDGTNCIYKQLKRPPQSWCYVEKVVE